MNNFASFSTHGVSAFVNGKLFVADKDHCMYKDIVAAIQSHAWDDLPEMFNLTSAIEGWDEEMEVHDGHVFFRGVPLVDSVSDKILRMIGAGQSAESLKNFLVRVHQNPSLDARRELLLFCDANRFLIHEDGRIVAFKAITHDWRDKYTRKIDNSVGAVVSMDRGSVDDNRNRTCSRGLHFAALDYAANVYGRITAGGDRLVLIAVCPSDVVSIPADYNNQKGRCCEYEVLSEIGLAQAAYFADEVEVVAQRDYVDDWDFNDDEDDDCFCPDDDDCGPYGCGRSHCCF